jgi:hypothetical protein
MQIDAHYYAVLAFARACGFKKEAAFKIAYASQFVDDAKINHIIINGNLENIEYDIIDDKPAFFNMATCHHYFKIKSLNYSSMINNTSAFHFVPGCKGKNFIKKMRCQQDSIIIGKIFKDALLEEDPVKLGVALHPYADTFVHQGFSGLISKVNDIKKVKLYSNHFRILEYIIVTIIQKFIKKSRYDAFFDQFMPAYGHGQALTYPDLPFLKWSYEYDYSDEFSESYKSSGIIDNKQRFQVAFEKIKQYLQTYLENHPQYKDNNIKFDNFDILFETLKAKKWYVKRKTNWRKLLLKYGFFEKHDQELKYNDYLWLKQSFSNFKKKKFKKRKVTDAILSDDFNESSWYKFYLAVKWYKELFFKYCFIEGLDIAR